MNIGELKKLIQNLPDEHRVTWADANFGGDYPFGGKVQEVDSNDITWDLSTRSLRFSAPMQESIEE